ncbi:hypothetical protein LTR95_009373 [Oleoguttula sp. CCFEE 5521]
MATDHGKLDYTKCRIDELRQFVQDREVITSNAYAHSDHSKTFHRFDDLPPEIRLLIYAYPLTYGEPLPAQTAILRVSKQVYSEAAPVLYNATSFRIVIEGKDAMIWVGDVERGLLKPAMLMGNGRAYKACDALQAMRKTRQVSIVLHMTATMERRDFQYFHAIVRAFSLHMVQAPTLKAVTFEVKGAPIIWNTGHLQMILAPCAVLPRSTKLIVTGVSCGAGTAVTLMRQKRMRPRLLRDNTTELRTTLVAAREVLDELEASAASLGRPHRTVIRYLIRQLYNEGGAMETIDMAEINVICQKLSTAVKAGENFVKALKGAISLQPDMWQSKMSWWDRDARL